MLVQFCEKKWHLNDLSPKYVHQCTQQFQEYTLDSGITPQKLISLINIIYVACRTFVLGK
jgi:hypothetical protein